MQNQHAPVGSQSIHCNVASCRYNDSAQYCVLKGIQVQAVSQGNTGRPEDESMCASYEVQ